MQDVDWPAAFVQRMSPVKVVSGTVFLELSWYKDAEWCENRKCVIAKNLNGCYECCPAECRKGLYAEKSKARAFAEYARRFGLEETLNTYAGAYLDGIDSQFLFVIEEIGKPNDEDISEEIELTDVDIFWPVQQKDDGSIWVHRLGDIEYKTYIHHYLKDLLADTFINVNAKICKVSETGMQKYGTLMKSFSTIDMRLIEVGGKWYILLADWSD